MNLAHPMAANPFTSRGATFPPTPSPMSPEMLMPSCFSVSWQASSATSSPPGKWASPRS